MSYYSHWELDFKSLKAVGVLELAKRALNQKVISYKVSGYPSAVHSALWRLLYAGLYISAMQSKPLNIPFAVLDHEAMSHVFFRWSYEDSIYF